MESLESDTDEKRARVRHLYSDTMHVQTLILRKQAVIKNVLLHHMIKHVLLLMYAKKN